MTKIIDLTGQKFGNLTAIKRIKINNTWKWECQCDCGNKTFVSTGCLRNGKTKSCGCYRIKNIKNEKYGRLLAVKIVGSQKSGAKNWLCKCDCGNECVVEQYHLTSGKTKSCGCIKKERLSVHGLSRSRVYKIYRLMKNRCYNKNSDSYSDYGGRGITICKEWIEEKEGFKNFYNWSIQNGYSEDLTIDRIDVNGNYEPTNCRWVNRKIQQNNTRRNDYIEYNGETKTLSEWAYSLNINKKTLYSRLHIYGWSVERALTEKTHEECASRKKVVK